MRSPARDFSELEREGWQRVAGKCEDSWSGLTRLFIPDLLQALHVKSVLRAGGRFGFTTWGQPDVSPGASIVDEAVRAHANTNAGVPAGPNYFGDSDPAEYRWILGRLGFDPCSLEFRTVTAEWRIPTASFLFECERDASVRTAALLAAQTPEALSAIEAHMTESALAYAMSEGFVIPYTANVIAITAEG